MCTLYPALETFQNELRRNLSFSWLSIASVTPSLVSAAHLWVICCAAFIQISIWPRYRRVRKLHNTWSGFLKFEGKIRDNENIIKHGPINLKMDISIWFWFKGFHPQPCVQLGSIRILVCLPAFVSYDIRTAGTSFNLLHIIRNVVKIVDHQQHCSLTSIRLCY